MGSVRNLQEKFYSFSTIEIENGMWAIHWFTQVSNCCNFKCGEKSLQLTSTSIGRTVALCIEENQGAGQPSIPLLNVFAACNGEMKAMIATGREKLPWTVAWTYRTNIDFNRRHYVSFMVILKFQVPTKGKLRVLAHLANLLDTPAFADMTFLVKDEKISAHAAIVMSGSPVMCAMFKHKEGRTKTVEEKDIEPAVFKEMLRFLYTGIQPKLDTDAMTMPLLQAADKYQIEGLRNLCEQTLIARLNEDSIVDYLIVSYHFVYAPRLWDACVQFLVDNGNKVYCRQDWEELSKNDHQLMKAVRMRTLDCMFIPHRVYIAKK